MNSNIGHIRYYLHAALTHDDWVFDYTIPAYNNVLHGNVVLSIELRHDDTVMAYLLDAECNTLSYTSISTVQKLVSHVQDYVDKKYLDTDEAPSIPDAVTDAVTRLADETQQAISSQDLLRLSQVKIKHKEVVEMILNCECDALTIEAKVSGLGEAIETALNSTLQAIKKQEEVNKVSQPATPKMSKKEVKVKSKPTSDDAPPIAQRKHVKVYLISDVADEFEVDVSGRTFDADGLEALKSLLTRKLGKQDAKELYQEVYDAIYGEDTQPTQDDQEATSSILDCTLPIEDRVIALRRHYDLVKLDMCDAEDEYDTMVSIAEALCELDVAIDMTQPLDTYISFDDPE